MQSFYLSTVGLICNMAELLIDRGESTVAQERPILDSSFLVAVFFLYIYS